MVNDIVKESNQAHWYVLLACMCLVMILELCFAAKRITFNDRTNRWFANVSLFLIGSIVVHLIFPIIGIAAALWGEHHHIGLFNLFEAPLVVSIPIYVLTADLLFYGLHRLYHRVPALWQFHQIHHSDTQFDFTTSLRFHPIETLIATSGIIVLILLLGAPTEAALTYFIVHALLNTASHANVYLPSAMAKKMELVFVTPNFHSLHHSQHRASANSNFGTIFTLWDRLFSTATCQNASQLARLRFGVGNINEKTSQSIVRLLALPFKRRKH